MIQNLRPRECRCQTRQSEMHRTPQLSRGTRLTRRLQGRAPTHATPQLLTNLTRLKVSETYSSLSLATERSHSAWIHEPQEPSDRHDEHRGAVGGAEAPPLLLPLRRKSLATLSRAAAWCAALQANPTERPRHSDDPKEHAFDLGARLPHAMLQSCTPLVSTNLQARSHRGREHLPASHLEQLHWLELLRCRDPEPRLPRASIASSTLPWTLRPRNER